MQLLDLMYTLHSQAAGVHQEIILNYPFFINYFKLLIAYEMMLTNIHKNEGRYFSPTLVIMAFVQMIEPFKTS